MKNFTDIIRDVFALPIEKRPNSLRPLVYKRIAIAKILRDDFGKKLRLYKIGNILFVDHATILYYLKKHNDYSIYTDYKEIFNEQKYLYDTKFKI